jgi:Lhr-like helicase
MDKFLVRRPPTDSTSSASNSLAEKLNAVNKEIFGFSSFRPHQLDIIQAILRNEDVFVIMPTGGGKNPSYLEKIYRLR